MADVDWIEWHQHGHHNPDGPHAGDLPNLVANVGGIARFTGTLEQFRLEELADGDGTALVIRANADDMVTNSGPAGPGNSDARIACGTLAWQPAQ
jgi:superoxide dismutase, Cu-Zn family